MTCAAINWTKILTVFQKTKHYVENDPNISTSHLNQVEIAEIKREFMAYDGTYLAMSWRAL